MKFGAIDIGTNAARLLIGEVVEDNGTSTVKKISYTRIPLRLGIEVFENCFISEKKAQEFKKSILAFKLISEVFEVKGHACLCNLCYARSEQWEEDSGNDKKRNRCFN